MQNPTELLSRLDEIASQYLLSDFDQVRAVLAGLGASLAQPTQREKARELETLAQALASPSEDPNLGGKFEAALANLRAALETPAEPQASSASSALCQDPELVGDFLLEAREHLQNVEKGLLGLEKDPTHKDTLHSVFRSFHTIKGLAGFLEFAAIQEVSHEVETILDLARNGQMIMGPALIDLTLNGSDFVQSELNRIEAELRGELLPSAPRADLLLRLKAAAQGELPVAPEVCMLPDRLLKTEESPPPTAGAVADAAAATPEPAPQPATAKRAQAQESYAIRVDTAKLDYLLDMVGEMVIAESMVRLDPEIGLVKNARLQRNLTQLRRVTEEVQKVAMATRMVPVATLFQRVNRLVRDTCRKAAKQAEVVFVGEETQLDKTIIEELTDPIMHMVRNSIDHGIEVPAQRTAAGKPAAGTIHLKAYRQADHIQIEIVDDGRGLNKEKIWAKALERGLVTESSVLSDPEIFQLIFEPGFSTAEKVTDLSGRGVGMDVVKKQIQKLRGKIEIQSVAGKGTTFYLKLPLTLAIIDGLVVGVGRERFIVPIYSVHEMFRPADGQIATVQGKGEMVMVRNNLLPVVRLDRALDVRGHSQASKDGLMIVAETEGRRFVLMVDEFIGKQEVVIKSLGESLKSTPGVAGGAILGDGRVGLILDLEGIYRGRHGSGANRQEKASVTLLDLQREDREEGLVLAC